ncbi:RHS repeat-associated core domain-containing protein, partial [Candidatus Pantoea multigeneris]
NGEHRLAKVTVTPDRPAMPQTVVQFRYDALGRRTEKQVHYVSRNRSWHPVVPLPASYRVRFVWDGLRLVQEIRRDGSTTYVYSDTDSYVPLARIDTPDRAREYTRIYWYHTRPDGTPEQLSDSNGEEVWRIVNDAWGRVDTAWGEINSAAVREDNLRMQGQYLDRETGLHYNLFRYYDADSMHFISPDPIGLAGGLNLYAYAPDPVNWVDPLGLKCWNSARRDYWKAEAKAAPKGMYSPVNMLRMRFGLAPRIRVKELHFRTGEERIRNVSLELNHRYWPQRDGKHVDIPYNLEKVTPWEHAAKDPYRHVGSELLEIIQNIGNYKGF